VAITPDYSEVAKLTDLWLNPKQGTDAALAQAFNHVIFKEFHLDHPSPYFTDYAKRFTDLPVLVMLKPVTGFAPGAGFQPDRFLRASDLVDNLGQDNNPEWKTIALDESGELVSPQGSIGYRWGEKGKWNILAKEGGEGRAIDLKLSLMGADVAEVGFPYFAGESHEHFQHVAGDAVQFRRVPVHSVTLADGSVAKVATVFDLSAANLAIDRGLGGSNVAKDYDDASVPGTPAWQEAITGVSREKAIQIARGWSARSCRTASANGRRSPNRGTLCGSRRGPRRTRFACG
jgi:nitrate reductase alpha subunit